jgi:hypothetical protein
VSSDGKTHGQVKQAGKFAFARIYESGHEVPFYKPLVSLEMFERVINGMDIKTGKTEITSAYRTKGTPRSTYHQGNATVQTEVVGEDDDVVYDVSTNLPVYENGTSADTGSGSGGPPDRRMAKRESKVSEAEKKRREKRNMQRRQRREFDRRNRRRNPVGAQKFGAVKRGEWGL